MVDKRKQGDLPLARIPAAIHLLRRQARQAFRCVLSTLQFCWKRHLYWCSLRILRRKNPLQPSQLIAPVTIDYFNLVLPVRFRSFKDSVAKHLVYYRIWGKREHPPESRFTIGELHKLKSFKLEWILQLCFWESSNSGKLKSTEKTFNLFGFWNWSLKA